MSETLENTIFVRATEQVFQRTRTQDVLSFDTGNEASRAFA